LSKFFWAVAMLVTTVEMSSLFSSISGLHLSRGLTNALRSWSRTPPQCVLLLQDKVTAAGKKVRMNPAAGFMGTLPAHSG
jgi:hypothetical protein